MFFCPDQRYAALQPGLDDGSVGQRRAAVAATVLQRTDLAGRVAVKDDRLVHDRPRHRAVIQLVGPGGHVPGVAEEWQDGGVCHLHRRFPDNAVAATVLQRIDLAGRVAVKDDRLVHDRPRHRAVIQLVGPGGHVPGVAEEWQDGGVCHLHRRFPDNRKIDPERTLLSPAFGIVAPSRPFDERNLAVRTCALEPPQQPVDVVELQPRALALSGAAAKLLQDPLRPLDGAFVRDHQIAGIEPLRVGQVAAERIAAL